ncbi:MAG TPA: hypothetical protein VKG92_01715, partial [Flavobacteriales bacterium]|nr:hypothetical protein [Flavobacteriales bacterium]
ARPVKYAREKGSANRTWYSASMGILGTLILLFLIVHLLNFWVKTRFTGIEEYGVDVEGQENLYALMVEAFKYPLAVVIYLLGCFSLFWHLLHGFKSAFQSLGINHKRYNGFIAFCGIAFSVVVPAFFAAMPIAIHFKLLDQ